LENRWTNNISLQSPSPTIRVAPSCYLATVPITKSLNPIHHLLEYKSVSTHPPSTISGATHPNPPSVCRLSLPVITQETKSLTCNPGTEHRFDPSLLWLVLRKKRVNCFLVYSGSRSLWPFSTNINTHRMLSCSPTSVTHLFLITDLPVAKHLVPSPQKTRTKNAVKNKAGPQPENVKVISDYFERLVCMNYSNCKSIAIWKDRQDGLKTQKKEKKKKKKKPRVEGNVCPLVHCMRDLRLFCSLPPFETREEGKRKKVFPPHDFTRAIFKSIPKYRAVVTGEV